MKVLGILVVMVCGAVLLAGTGGFPDFMDPAAPPAVHVSPHYIEDAVPQTSVPNIVTAVLADYRAYDTMFETAVVFTAAIACFFLLRVARPVDPETRLYRHRSTGITLRIDRGGKLPESSVELERIDDHWVPHDVIIKTTTRLIIPFIQIFALYVIAHGHHSPGGGFQGGVILGAAVILYAISQNLRQALLRMGERASFLDYTALSPIFRVDPIQARSLGILVVEIGVGISVMAAMVWIYYNLASLGRHDEGL